MEIPEGGRDRDNIVRDLYARKEDDINWRSGKISGYIYHGIEGVKEFNDYIYTLYSRDTAANPSRFPSLIQLENEIIEMTADLHNGRRQVVGNITSGGTESNLLAVKTARDFALEHSSDIDIPEIIVPQTGHPSIAKAADYFGLKEIRTPVASDWRADVDEISSAISDQTVLIVASAPNAPVGVVDPIEELGEVAESHDIPLHVDACLGGFVLPFLGDLGCEIPSFDFSVAGVTSLAVDQHKFGYSNNGVASILYRDPEMRRYQYHVFDNWPIGMYKSAVMRGTRSGGPVASAWATMKFLGMDGYREAAKAVRDSVETIQTVISRMDKISIVGNPSTNVFAFQMDDDTPIKALDIEMRNRGWILTPVRDPPALKINVTYLTKIAADEFETDLQSALNALDDWSQTDLENVRGVTQHSKASALDEMDQLYRLE